MEPLISSPSRLTDAPGRSFAGALAFITGGVLYLSIEVIVAAAWSSPPYNYVTNYISDLGVVDAQVYEGRDVDSPLGVLMNTGFVLAGLFFLVGAALLAGLFSAVWRWLFVSSAALYCAGIVLVGLFNEAADAGSLHVIGAFLAIGFGNLTALVAGVRAVSAGLPRWFAVASVALPVLGAFSEFVLLAELTDSSLDGLWERGGVYSVTAFQLLIGVAVLMTLRAHARRIPSKGSKR